MKGGNDMAAIVRGGSTIMKDLVPLARKVQKYTAAGCMAYGVSLPGAAALSVLAEIIIALDAAGAFAGQGGGRAEALVDNLEAEQLDLLTMTKAQKLALLAGL